MVKNLFAGFIVAFMLNIPCSAQFNLSKAISAGAKTLQAVTLTDAQIEAYVKEYIDWSDKNNTICADDDPYAIRLAEITKNINGIEGINIKAYKVEDVNAFACADGSVRVFTGLMDIMSDEEILGVIGHEIGHVKNKDTKDAFRNSLLTSAVRDGISSAGGKVASLSDSQLGNLGESLMGARYSQKQEYEADEYGYNFLKEHGINPWAMALSFEKLKKLQDEAGSNKNSMIQQLFSTHPDIEARTKAMTEKAIADGFERPVSKSE